MGSSTLLLPLGIGRRYRFAPDAVVFTEAAEVPALDEQQSYGL
jgi:hypothetical protein